MLPITAQQCFFIAIFAFVIAGFYRGWKREVISLAFILVAVIVVRASSGSAFGQLLMRIVGAIGGIISGTSSASSTPATPSFFQTPWATLLVFALVVALGYLVGNKVFPRPATPTERFFGIVPALISGAFVLYYLESSTLFPTSQGQVVISENVPLPNPADYVGIIVIIAIIAAVIALVASRAKKTSAKK